MKKLLVGIALLLAFFCLGLFAASSFPPLVFINNLIEGFFTHIRSTAGVNLMLIVTKMGEPEFQTPLVGIFLIIFLLFRQWKYGLILPLASWITSGMTSYTKNFYAVVRPIPTLDSVGGYSFPSGHTSSAAIVFLVIIIALLSVIKNHFLRIASITICVVCIVVVGISRMYLNVHWFSDVVGGLLLSSGVLLVLLGIASIVEKKDTYKSVK